MSADSEAIVHEEAFVNAFIQKDRRERLLFELRKHRERFLQRFNHGALIQLDPRYVVAIKPPNSDPAETLRLLKSKGAASNCYAISTSGKIDGCFSSLYDALAVAVGYGMPTILSCIPGQLAYLETEQVVGPPDRYILFRPPQRP